MLTELELKYKREFKIYADDVTGAVESADIYGQTLVDFRFVRRYYLLCLSDVIWCFPTDREESHMLTFIEYYNKENK